jgi:hypothetical protein
MQGVGQDILFSCQLNFASPPPVINNEWSLKEIKFVAKMLRCLLSKNNTDLQHADINVSDNIDHDNLLNNNFWGKISQEKIIWSCRMYSLLYYSS